MANTTRLALVLMVLNEVRGVAVTAPVWLWLVHHVAAHGLFR